jgi:hypothetical protein
MSEFGYLLERTAAHQINERVATKQRSRVPGQRRRRTGRRALVSGLHGLADRLDT